jgi:hypothetical protein
MAAQDPTTDNTIDRLLACFVVATDAPTDHQVRVLAERLYCQMGAGNDHITFGFCKALAACMLAPTAEQKASMRAMITAVRRLN